MLKKGIFSPQYFYKLKKMGSYRMILNLKNLNKFIDSEHFKIESLSNVLHMVKSGIWMASVELKDAYYSVPIHEE